MTPADAPTVFVSSDDAAVRAVIQGCPAAIGRGTLGRIRLLGFALELKQDYSLQVYLWGESLFCRDTKASASPSDTIRRGRGPVRTTRGRPAARLGRRPNRTPLCEGYTRGTANRS
jgi:hypothetical protein